ncbi:hypothetical protein BJ912DRAFT_924081 [Pholiota molesta]|nr:hypothetical protein BJ912DRAFT_924081 [Pholiota molesta]
MSMRAARLGRGALASPPVMINGKFTSLSTDFYFVNPNFWPNKRPVSARRLPAAVFGQTSRPGLGYLFFHARVFFHILGLNVNIRPIAGAMTGLGCPLARGTSSNGASARGSDDAYQWPDDGHGSTRTKSTPQDLDGWSGQRHHNVTREALKLKEIEHMEIVIGWGRWGRLCGTKTLKGGILGCGSGGEFGFAPLVLPHAHKCCPYPHGLSPAPSHSAVGDAIHMPRESEPYRRGVELIVNASLRFHFLDGQPVIDRRMRSRNVWCSILDPPCPEVHTRQLDIRRHPYSHDRQRHSLPLILTHTPRGAIHPTAAKTCNVGPGPSLLDRVPKTTLGTPRVPLSPPTSILTLGVGLVSPSAHAACTPLPYHLRVQRTPHTMQLLRRGDALGGCRARKLAYMLDLNAAEKGRVHIW